MSYCTASGLSKNKKPSGLVLGDTGGDATLDKLLKMSYLSENVEPSEGKICSPCEVFVFLSTESRLRTGRRLLVSRSEVISSNHLLAFIPGFAAGCVS